jgi:hypothetical protein
MVNSVMASSCCMTMSVPTWPTEILTTWMPCNGRHWHNVHMVHTYCHANFMSLDPYRKPSYATYSYAMKMCRRVWYSRTQQNMLQTGHTNLCTNGNPVYVPVLIFPVILLSPVSILKWVSIAPASSKMQIRIWTEFILLTTQTNSRHLSAW